MALRVAVLGSADDPSLRAVLHPSPQDARLFSVTAVTQSGSDEEAAEALRDAEVLLVARMVGVKLGDVLRRMRRVRWVHCRMTGVDHVLREWRAAINEGEAEGNADTEAKQEGAEEQMCSPTDIVITNARGCFSSALAEYALFACGWFAKRATQLLRQKEVRAWERFSVGELRGATMGVLGYGDIGQACGRLAKAYGMRLVVQRRRPELSDDGVEDAVYGAGKEGVLAVMRESDYVVVAAPLTEQTHHMLDAEAFAAAKSGAIFINIGRGPVVEEGALVHALREGQIAGAALDVFEKEPLPEDSPLWDMDNVLISPHCADVTDHWLHDSTDVFLRNMRLYANGDPLTNIIDKDAGY